MPRKAAFERITWPHPAASEGCGNMERKRGGAYAELTCAAGAAGDSAWVFAGDSAGRVLALPRVETAGDATGAREVRPGSVEATAWTVDACAAAITVRCTLLTRDSQNTHS